MSNAVGLVLYVLLAAGVIVWRKPLAALMYERQASMDWNSDGMRRLRGKRPAGSPPSPAAAQAQIRRNEILISLFGLVCLGAVGIWGLVSLFG